MAHQVIMGGCHQLVADGQLSGAVLQLQQCTQRHVTLPYNTKPLSDKCLSQTISRAGGAPQHMVLALDGRLHQIIDPIYSSLGKFTPHCWQDVQRDSILTPNPHSQPRAIACYPRRVTLQCHQVSMMRPCHSSTRCKSSSCPYISRPLDRSI